MKRLSKRTTPVLMALSLTVLLWPVDPSHFTIEYDNEGVEKVQEFLKSETTANPNQPNIVIILADDLGITDISAYGNQLVNTPHIDAIGKNGVQFSQGYITSPICSPSRAGLLTGRYQQRFGFEYVLHERYPKNRAEYLAYKWLIPSKRGWKVREEYARPRFEDVMRQGLPPTEITLAELLKKHGYKTACIGKWHLGYNSNAIPNARGFEYQYGFYQGFTLYDDPKDSTIVNSRHNYFADKHIWKKGRTGNCCLRKNHHEVYEDQFLTTKLAEEAVNYIDQNKEEPFFLYVPFLTPHTPFQITKEYYDQFSHIKDHNKRVYYAMIKSLDDAVGEIMLKLESENLLENTLVFFLSDNGGATYTKATQNFPFKGGKLTNFEGGLRVPFMMQWKGKINPNQQYNHPISSLDIFTTVAEVAQLELPTFKKYDGVNLMPYLQNKDTTAPHACLYWRIGYAKAIRKGDWKLIVNEKSAAQWLYNMSIDPYEKNNLSGDSLELGMRLREELNTWESSLMNPSWPTVMDYRFKFKDGVYFAPL